MKKLLSAVKKSRAAVKGRSPQNRKGAGGGKGARFQPGQSCNPATQFKPGQSGSPGGRPRTHGLLDVLRSAVDETVAKALVAVLIAKALKGRNPLPAIQTIFDRLEGRPKQQLDLNDITAAMSNRSPDDLVFYAEHGYWPEDESTADVSEDASEDASEEDEQHES